MMDEMGLVDYTVEEYFDQCLPWRYCRMLDLGVVSLLRKCYRKAVFCSMASNCRILRKSVYYLQWTTAPVMTAKNGVSLNKSTVITQNVLYFVSCIKLDQTGSSI